MSQISIPLQHLSTCSYPPIQKDPDLLVGRLKDAAGISGPIATGVFLPESEAQLSSFLATHAQENILSQGARTSLTGGATPHKDLIVSLEKLNQIQILSEKQVKTGAGVYLRDLLAHLEERKLYYPPVPTFDGATIGGTLATNAAGAASFKYGTTRDWVRKIRLVLRHGEILELERGSYIVSPGDSICLVGKEKKFKFTLPHYLTPPLKKISAGYYSRPEMDLIDLFIGSEGTLGIFSEMELGLLPKQKVLTGLVFFESEDLALKCTTKLRQASLTTWEKQERLGIDIRSIEFMDSHCLTLLCETKQLQAMKLPRSSSKTALLFELELSNEISTEQVQEDLFQVFENLDEKDSPVIRLARIFKEFGVLEFLELAFPAERKKYQQLIGLREAVPITVNERIAQQQQKTPEIYKCAGDFIVPFEKLSEMLKHYHRSFKKRNLSYAIWGHLSDGNLHPNVLPSSIEEMEKGRESLLELSQIVKELGGCPLSEHGVGKHPLKQLLLKNFYGETAITEMQKIKQVLDPGWTLASGVLFSPPQNFSLTNS